MSYIQKETSPNTSSLRRGKESAMMGQHSAVGDKESAINKQGVILLNLYALRLLEEEKFL